MVDFTVTPVERHCYGCGSPLALITFPDGATITIHDDDSLGRDPEPSLPARPVPGVQGLDDAERHALALYP